MKTEFPQGFTKKDRDFFKDKFKRGQWKHVHRFGGNSKIKPCRRLKFRKRIYGKLTGVQAAWLLHHKLPPEGVISHSCANPIKTNRNQRTSCVEHEHMNDENQRVNRQRAAQCHEKIRTWFAANKDIKDIQGPIFMRDIELPDADVVDDDDDEKANEVGLRRSSRVKAQKKKERRRGHCTHRPLCFINYGEL